MSYDPRYQVKQFVAVVANGAGTRFMVFETGDAKHYLFTALGPDGDVGSVSVPVRKTDLRTDCAPPAGERLGERQPMTDHGFMLGKLDPLLKRGRACNKWGIPLRLKRGEGQAWCRCGRWATKSADGEEGNAWLLAAMGAYKEHLTAERWHEDDMAIARHNYENEGRA